MPIYNTLNLPTELSGMVYSNFYYPPEYWLNLIGTDPRHYPQYFVIRNDLVGCNERYRNECDRYFAGIDRIFAQITDRVTFS
jgi:hypothetical protein